RSVAGAVTVMVPNSLGPGELLMQFGTDAQRKYWLPRLARGQEIPAFGLTSDHAGSDAAAMRDEGVITHGTWKGKKTLGIRLNWHKRYITLGPVATVLGLAFKLKDPDGLLGKTEDLGITVALVPTNIKGVTIGDRHIPSGQAFQNGPNWGKDVFIPLSHVIGGKANVGQGWKMLMSALAAGRGISLPSQSAGAAALAARTSGAYGAVREQFGLPVGRFEGVQEKLARIAANAYRLDAARRLTCAGLDEGRKLAVVSAIMKAHATYRMRDALTDAMDVHGGKTVIDGPMNYLGSIYQSVPVGITVEGANDLTRNMIIFGQGAIRCHPHLLDEMLALEESDPHKALDDFDSAFWRHVGHSTKTLFRALGRGWSKGLLAPTFGNGVVRDHARQLSRYAAGFALAADMALLTLGGDLKRKEMLSARLGDILSELYMMSAVLKRFRDEGDVPEDEALVDYCMAESARTIENAFDEIFANLPSRITARFLRFVILPFGARTRGPSDEVKRAVADLISTPGMARERLTERVFPGRQGDAIHDLERAFEMVSKLQSQKAALKKAGVNTAEEGLKAGVITEEDADNLKAMEEAVGTVITVDHFPPEMILGKAPSKSGARTQTRRTRTGAASAGTSAGAGTKKKAPAKTAPAKKAPAKKASAKKAPAKATSAKKAPAKKAPTKAEPAKTGASGAATTRKTATGSTTRAKKAAPVKTGATARSTASPATKARRKTKPETEG
ncbi:acyl-CoA dehydrogenase, partial [Yunchengibacter salinarum]|uniref:acyl-CoA dehydrogenase n=1 Tax=Yunchengibacter salinarum TaxID=3133399 RepID=UPI0035B67833